MMVYGCLQARLSELLRMGYRLEAYRIHSLTMSMRDRAYPISVYVEEPNEERIAYVVVYPQLAREGSRAFGQVGYWIVSAIGDQLYRRYDVVLGLPSRVVHKALKRLWELMAIKTTARHLLWTQAQYAFDRQGRLITPRRFIHVDGLVSWEYYLPLLGVVGILSQAPSAVDQYDPLWLPRYVQEFRAVVLGSFGQNYPYSLECAMRLESWLQAHQDALLRIVDEFPLWRSMLDAGVIGLERAV